MTQPKREHAVLSPSSAHRWILCPAAPFMEKDFPSQSSKYASEGTFAHAVGAHCLINNLNPTELVDTLFKWEDHGEHCEAVITKDMGTHVQTYVDYVREKANGGQLLVEQRMSIEHITGEEGAEGTADDVVLYRKTLKNTDLKYGMGVKVDAEDNYQLMMYSLAALEEFDFVDFEDVELAISQPRLGHVSEHTMKVPDLLRERDEIITPAAKKATEIMTRGYANAEDFNPCEKACRFCKASGTCHAQARKVMTDVLGDFAEIDTCLVALPAEADAAKEYGHNQLSAAMASVPFIKDWCKAVEQRLQSEIMRGVTIDGWKLVQGRAGNSKWTDEEAVDRVAKSLKIKVNDFYVKKPISPTQAKKQFEKAAPGWWKKLSEFVTRSDGSPIVVPSSDKRPAIAVPDVMEDFAEFGED